MSRHGWKGKDLRNRFGDEHFSGPVGLCSAGDLSGSDRTGPLVGPFIAIFSFVCSVGNMPIAAFPWRGGFICGGVAASSLPIWSSCPF